VRVGADDDVRELTAGNPCRFTIGAQVGFA
jgi:hypothetical protein